MSEPDRHHYLPIFYLSQWTGPDGKVVRYYRPHQDVVASPITPANTGYEPGLYRLDGYPQEFRNAIETDYMARAVDGPASEALKVLLAGDTSKLVPPLQSDWTRFLLSLIYRVPHMVKAITEDAERTLRESLAANPEQYDTVRTEAHPPTLVEWVEQRAPHLLAETGKSFLPGLIESAKLGNAILKMQWCVWTLHREQNIPNLLTSDNPIFMSHGLGHPTCVVALPIAPYKVFFASQNETTLKTVFDHGPARVAKELNASMVNQAQQCVFGSHARHLRFVEKRLRR